VLDFVGEIGGTMEKYGKAQKNFPKAWRIPLFWRKVGWFHNSVRLTGCRFVARWHPGKWLSVSSKKKKSINLADWVWLKNGLPLHSHSTDEN